MTMRQMAAVERSFMDTSLPYLIPPVPGDAAAQNLAVNPCGTVTRVALEATIEAINAAKLKADENVVLNGNGAPRAIYPTAAMLAQEAMVTALDTMTTLLGILAGQSLFEPPDDRVSNVAASFNVYGYARESVIQLHYARHWAAVSASHNGERADAAIECTEGASDALALLERISADATRCYLQAYLP